MQSQFICIRWICLQTWKEEKEREKENRKAETIKQSSTWKRATDSKLEQVDLKSKFKEALHLPISPFRDQLCQLLEL